MSRTRRRSRTDVEADILRVARDGALKTRIVYQANLNFRIVKGYLASLLERGLIELDGRMYFPTERAKDYLAAYEALSAL